MIGISLIMLFQDIAANVQYLCLEINVKEVFCGDEVGSRTWEFQSDVLLCGLLLSKGLDLLCHLLVEFEQLLQLPLLPSQFLLQVLKSIGLQSQSSLVICL